MIYFDNSATTYPKPEVVYKALDYANRNLAFNAGRGTYNASLEASKIIEETRIAISEFVNVDPSQVSFVSSATEALNIIILGLGISDGDTIYISPFEHNAIIRPLYNLQKKIRFDILKIPFDKETWDVEIDKLDEMFSIKRPKAVFLSQLSNVTGFLLQYNEIFSLSKKYKAITILDSAQSFGIKNPNLNFVDYCVFAGHKSLYASFGIAGIISSKYQDLNVVKSGGNGSDSLNHEMPFTGHERIEAGSPNIVAIYGLLASTKWLKKQNILKNEMIMTNYLLQLLSEVKKVIIYKPSHNIESLLGIVSINVEGYTSDDVASILSNEFDISVRAGYHCSPFVHEFIGSDAFHGTVRISLGVFNTKDEIVALIDALKTL